MEISDERKATKMYKQMAAYAIALMRNEKYFMPAVIEGQPVWGVSENGKYLFSGLAYASKLSVLGAMRAAQEEFESTSSRSYNSLDKYARHYAQEIYGKSLTDLDHVEVLQVLRVVAR